SALVPAAALIAGFAALCFSWDLRIDRGLRTTQGKAFWSSAIGELGRDLTSRPAGAPRPKILSWGLRNNLYIVSGGSLYGSELYWDATEERSRRGRTWADEIGEGGSFLLLLFPTGPPSLDAAAHGFSRALRESGAASTARTYFDRSGVPVARWIEIPPTR